MVERLVVFASGDKVTYDDLPAYLHKEEPASSEVPTDIPLEAVSLEDAEWDLILKAFIKSNWNQIQTVRYLDLRRKAPIYHMESMGTPASATKGLKG